MNAAFYPIRQDNAPVYMNTDRIKDLCRRFGRLRVVVVGDVMLDHYLCGEVRRISPEAPVPIMEVTRDLYRPGGAANVAINLAALGAQAKLFGVTGDDAAAGLLRGALVKGGINRAGLLVEAERPTTVKARIVAGHQQLLRLDRTRKRLLAGLLRSLSHAAAVIIADYAKGVIDADMLRAIIRMARKAGVPVCMDPKPRRPLPLLGCALLTPNRREAFELANMPDESVGLAPAKHAGLRRAMKRIHDKYAPRILLVTLGEDGMVVWERGGSLHHIPAVAREVYDVSGAGDTVIATFVLARAAGADAIEAAVLANKAAGVVVDKLGATSVNPAELIDVGL